jgi:membrane protein CcdC involved in cytochrome C biogenesis
MQLTALFGSAAAMAGAAGVLVWRVHETRRPVSTRTIVVPPLAMSTGFAMFVVPAMRVPLSWGLIALLAGALLLAPPMARTTRLERAGGAIMMRRSRTFLAILLALVAVRFALRGYLDHIVSPLQTGALLYLLAFGMIASWRARMLIGYRRLTMRA